MLPRLLLIAGLVGLAGWSDALTPTRAADPPQKKEPKKEPRKPKKEPKKEPPKESEKSPVTGPSRRPSKTGDLRKYDEVITKEAKTQAGVFAVHQVGETVYFEIPQEQLEKLMMFRAEVAKGPAGVSFNGRELGTKFIRFERRENHIYIIEATFDKRGDKAGQLAIEASATEPIIHEMKVEAEGKDRSVVVNATSLFMSDSLNVGARRAAGMGGSIDPSRSYLTSVKDFPKNIEVRALLTFRGGGRGGITLGPAGPIPFGGGGSSSATALVHYSLADLPDQPMMGRYFDPRVGYFTESFQDYASPKTWMVERQFIARFRLEKKDPSAAVSEPVKPIVFYLAPEIPEKWRSYMKKGVEDWQPAFEQAGFKNAIVCKDPPSRAEDPNWDPEDSRYSVIRWVAEPVTNAMGPHVHDPRSGEIISAHIIFWHDILKLTQLWYFVQCSPLDKRAHKLPFPDELTGDLLRYVTCHEVGHTLGLRHNHRASQAYSVKQLRDPKFLAAHGGPVASIMSYGRFNYVAQPEDKVPPGDLIPKLGPYDRFAIEWGYKPIPSAKTPAEEKSTLNQWAERQVKDPFLRFGGEDMPSLVDPTVLTENIGNDPMAATALGLKNLHRVLGWLVSGTTEKGEDFDVLQEAYQAIMMHRRNWFNAVLKQVGGVVEYRTLAGNGGEQFRRVPKEKEREAVKFLLEHAFSTPTDLFKPAIVNQFKFSGVANDVIGQQQAILRGLLGSGRLGRLMDAEIQDPENAYTLTELVEDVQAGLWSELKADAVKIDPLRRNIQRTYVELLTGQFKQGGQGGTVLSSRRIPILDLGEPIRIGELRAVARVALKDLRKQLEAALPKTKDAVTKAHLQDSLEEIQAALDYAAKK